jgi:hypothetical protein
MKAAELRIGNLVLYKETEVIPIKCHDIDWLERHAERPDMSPIPLTEEWLLRFGFEPEDDGNKRPRFIKDGVFALNKNGDVWYWKYYGANGDKDYAEIKYVHQLQNLYFALTGIELELSLKESPLPEQPSPRLPE